MKEHISGNEFDLEADLDYALENRSTYSMTDSEKSKSSNKSESDNESVHSYTSYGS